MWKARYLVTWNNAQRFQSLLVRGERMVANVQGERLPFHLLRLVGRLGQVFRRQTFPRGPPVLVRGYGEEEVTR